MLLIAAYRCHPLYSLDWLVCVAPIWASFVVKGDVGVTEFAPLVVGRPSHS